MNEQIVFRDWRSWKTKSKIKSLYWSSKSQLSAWEIVLCSTSYGKHPHRIDQRLALVTLTSNDSLEKDSSLLQIFRQHAGRYCWKTMPFGTVFGYRQDQNTSNRSWNKTWQVYLTCSESFTSKGSTMRKEKKWLNDWNLRRFLERSHVAPKPHSFVTYREG